MTPCKASTRGGLLGTRVGATIPQAKMQMARDHNLFAHMALIHDAFETEVTPEPSVKGDSASFEPAYGVGYSLDDLVMLSLLSDETHKKVERLMASMGTWLGVDDEGTRLFWKRRDELAPWVAQRLKEIRGH